MTFSYILAFIFVISTAAMAFASPESANAAMDGAQAAVSFTLSITGGIADVTLDNGGKLLTMRRALQEVSGRLTVFARPSQRPAFLRQLVTFQTSRFQTSRRAKGFRPVG